MELAVIDDGGRALPPGAIGEIAVRSIATMSGYFNDVAATAQVLTADGWLRTGDAGRLDGDGYLYPEDRIKDIVISGGENVYPPEVENAISAHPEVAEVAVIGIPDKRSGETVLAVVVLVPGFPRPMTSSPSCGYGSRFTNHRAVVFAKALPPNPAAKLLRRTLREIYSGEGSCGDRTENGS